MATIQRVLTDVGFHGRIVGDNGEPVWTTEVYPDRRKVDEAADLLLDSELDHELIVVDERTAGEQPAATINTGALSEKQERLRRDPTGPGNDCNY